MKSHIRQARTSGPSRSLSFRCIFVSIVKEVKLSGGWPCPPHPPALPSSLAAPSSLLHPFDLHLQSVDRHHRPRSSWLRQPTHLAIMTKVTEARPPSEPQTLMSAHFHMESNLHLHLHPGPNPIPTLSPTPACSWLSILPHTCTKPKRFCLALLDPHPKREEKRPCWSLHLSTSSATSLVQA